VILLVHSVVQDEFVASAFRVLVSRVGFVVFQRLWCSIDAFHGVHIQVDGIASEVVKIEDHHQIVLVQTVKSTVSTLRSGLTVDSSSVATVWRR